MTQTVSRGEYDWILQRQNFEPGNSDIHRSIQLYLMKEEQECEQNDDKKNTCAKVFEPGERMKL